ncbi:lipid-A-disaccharide synthase [Candidatus Poribacteria bacterium]|nr:lipid-A-disaccharide synthase [Candidatus Poribacteria bacterium]MBT7807099.1 lipid-A-disaccharide synthase [Candidatus Poribacteria bacterium]
MSGSVTVCISAGEPSGDVYGGMLARELLALEPGARLVGMGGREMASAGVELLIDIRDSSVLGLVEVAKSLPAFLRKRRVLREWIRDHRPDALVTVDFPDFNLGLAGQARSLGVPVVYLIPPKAWAWRRRRGATVAEAATRVLCLLPFAADFYRDAGANVEFIGHPLVDAIDGSGLPDSPAARSAVGLAEAAPILGLLPGSRTRELRALLPHMLDALEIVRESVEGATGVIALSGSASDVTVAEVTRLAEKRGATVVTGRTYEAIRASDAVLAASGTVTLECAIVGTPMVIAYRLSSLTYAVVRRLVRVDHSGLPNLLVGRRACPEYYQSEVTGRVLASAATELLVSDAARAAQTQAFAEMRAKLGSPGAMSRAATAVIETAVAAPA